MELTDLLKAQNNFIDALEQSKSIQELKKFNNILIEKMEFEAKYPFVFSEQITRMLVKNGFYYYGYSTGKSYRSYEKDNPRCRLYWDNNTICFSMRNKSSGEPYWIETIIPNESALTEEYLIELIKRHESN